MVQTSTEIRQDGQHHRKRDGAGLEGVGSSGDRGTDDPKYNPDPNDDHPEGPIPAREHKAILPGAEGMLNEGSEGFDSSKQEKVRDQAAWMEMEGKMVVYLATSLRWRGGC
jgi:hypothetical protein